MSWTALAERNAFQNISAGNASFPKIFFETMRLSCTQAILLRKSAKFVHKLEKKIGITDKSGRKFLLRAFAQIGKKTHPPFPIFLQIWKQRCLQMRSFNGFPTINSSLLILFVEGNAHCTVIVISDPSKRRVTVPKRINFRKGSKRSLTPPSSSENHISFFFYWLQSN